MAHLDEANQGQNEKKTLLLASALKSWRLILANVQEQFSLERCTHTNYSIHKTEVGTKMLEIYIYFYSVRFITWTGNIYVFKTSTFFPYV